MMAGSGVTYTLTSSEEVHDLDGADEAAELTKGSPRLLGGAGARPVPPHSAVSKPPRILRACTYFFSIVVLLLGITTVLGLRFGKTHSRPAAAPASPPANSLAGKAPRAAAPASPSAAPGAAGKPPVFGVKVVKALPHDRAAFTEGLEFHDGLFYESTGLYGHSSLRVVEPESGRVLRRRSLDVRYFGEGITLMKENGTIVMLTYHSGKGFIFRVTDFAQVGTFDYSGEGWALTTDRRASVPVIYMSDGTPHVRVFSSKSMARPVSVLKVTLNGQPLQNLNELEFVCGELWGNVFTTNRIVRIDPETGKVKAIIDVTGVLPRPKDVRGRVDVLNGIAFDPETGRLWLTGKYWPKVYQVEVDDPSLDLKSCK